MTGKSELILALEQIEREKGIRKDEILKMIEGAMISSLRKHVGKNAVIEAALDPDTADFTACVVKKVVEAVTDPELEISLHEARMHRRDAAVGGEVRIPAPVEEFKRIAAQTAKQVLFQKGREVERDSLFSEFKPKEGELVTGSVHRFMERNIIITLDKAEAILPLREQIRRERYNIGQSVRAAILKVDKAQRGPQIVLSRAAPVFLRRLFELEVPEVADKTVEIVDVVRDPGFRSKVAVRSTDPKVDAVGSCVGLRGSRIRSIMNELAGERIDLIPYDDDPAAYVANSLAPARVASVTILDASLRQAEALVNEEQLSVAIGKEGQNIRLAAKLTGWHLEVKTKPAEPKPAGEVSASGLSELEGVGPKTAGILSAAGYDDPHRLAEASVPELTALEGIGEKTAAKIVASAKQYAKDHPKSTA
ncbi:MAG: transcription termination/antitermination protein NusA [Elusimicrobia bacterium]|nr:transcription termination/antitermination protein NusA [Elusimicrobiota bacterium]